MRRHPGAVPLSVLVAGLALAASGCGNSDNSGGGSSSSAQSSTSGKVKTAIVLPCPRSDPWCAQGFSAVQKLASQGVIALKVVNGAPQDNAGVAQVLGQLAQSGEQLILAHSTWQDPALQTGQKFPKANLAFAGTGTTSKNVATYDEPIYEPAYLAGMIAGGITKSDVIGGTAGQDVPLCHSELVAFERGAKRTNPKVKMLSTYIGDWNDVAKGKSAATAQMDQKADVLISCGGAPANGMAQAIKGTKVAGFGYVGDMSAQAPQNMAGSIIYNLYPYFRAMALDVKDGKYSPGKTYKFGMAQDGVSLKTNPEFSAAKIPPDVQAEVDKVQKQIMDGSFKVPYVAGT
jgi:basic membrane protein A and related proteins